MATRPLTPDQAAVDILTNPSLTDEAKQRQLKALHEHVQVAIGVKCPECGSTDTEDNGARHPSDLTLRCRSCDHQWDAMPQ